MLRKSWDSKFISTICSCPMPVSHKCRIISFSRLDLPQRRIPVITFTGSVSWKPISFFKYRSRFLSSCDSIMAHSSCRSYHSTNSMKNQVCAVNNINFLFSTKNALSDKQQTTAVINRRACIIATADCTVKPHDGGDCAVNLLCGFFLVRFDIARRIGTDEDVIHHPSQHRVAAVGDFLFQ